MARLHEYQGKALLAQKGIPVPQGRAASTPEEAREIAAEIARPVVVKIQAWVTGRAGLGGICFTETADESAQAAADMLGMRVGGFIVGKVMVEEKLSIKREFYAGVSGFPPISSWSAFRVSSGTGSMCFSRCPQ